MFVFLSYQTWFISITDPLNLRSFINEIPDMALLSTAAAPSKLRLMGSYSGHIVPRPHNKFLFYSGGDTRIVSIPNATLSSFSATMSTALSVPAPFTLKYQLPGHNLNSLISLSSDNDLLIVLDELPHLPPPSRIRFFLFPLKAAHPEPTDSGARYTELTQWALCHPKTETWFIDALNSENCTAGQNESLSGGGAASGAVSIVLESNSSSGLTSSSVSLPSAKPQDDDDGNNFQENLARLPSSDPAPRYLLFHLSWGKCNAFVYYHRCDLIITDRNMMIPPNMLLMTTLGVVGFRYGCCLACLISVGVSFRSK